MIKKVALVTGASSGIGYEAAIQLHDKGFIVYGAARRMDLLETLVAKGINIVSLDVTKDDSMQACIESIISKEGRIDVLVNNAGYGSFGAVEDVSMEEARRQMDVNVFGLARMSQLVLPHMRKQKTGRIINITSIGGKVHSPFGGWYHATKFAVEGLSDCMRMELNDKGIKVILVEPGGIKTEWGAIAADNLLKSSKDGAYSELATQVAESTKKTYTSGKFLSSPSLIAKTIVKASTKKNPKTRYLVGAGAKPALFLRRILTDKAYDRVILRFVAKRTK
jgi:short-subunit dehydrogenase